MKTNSPQRPLESDERGAIMLLGVFMAIFMTGCLFYVVGIGHTLLYRTHLQDAADAAAMAAAVGHAKGMNAIVFINVVMAALLAILVALRLISTLAIGATVICTALCAYPPLSGLCAVAELTADVASEVEEVYGNLEDPVHNALEALHMVATVVRDVTPAASVAKSWEVVDTHFRDDVGCGIAVPPRLTLPTEDDEFSTLCEQAGRFTGDLVTAPLKAAIGDNVVGDIVSDAIGTLTGSIPDWFCGSGDASPPSTTKEHTMYYPRLASAERCGEAIDAKADDAEDICKVAEAEAAASAPNKGTGECKYQCDSDGPYEERATLARRECNPNRHRGLSEFQYQQRQRTQYLVRHRGGWRLDRETVDDNVIVDADSLPCARTRGNTSWNEARDGGPICLVAVERRNPSRDQEVVHITEVSEVFSCARTEKVQFEPTTNGKFLDTGGGKEGDTQQADGEDQDAENSEDQDMNPQMVEEGLRSGDSDFQVRAAVFGRDRAGTYEHLVAMDGRTADTGDDLPDWCGGAGDEDSAGDSEGGLFGTARTVGRLAIAQAEYYFAGTEPPELMMWRMQWTARLRRFRLEGRAGDEASESESQDSDERRTQDDSGGDSATSIFELLDGAVTH